MRTKPKREGPWLLGTHLFNLMGNEEPVKCLLCAWLIAVITSHSILPATPGAMSSPVVCIAQETEFQRLSSLLKVIPFIGDGLGVRTFVS